MKERIAASMLFSFMVWCVLINASYIQACGASMQEHAMQAHGLGLTWEAFIASRGLEAEATRWLWSSISSLIVFVVVLPAVVWARDLEEYIKEHRRLEEV